ncbi:MAG: 3-carboxy-cis,cis-muconate cycloisomerase [Pseudomonadota bacterium]
MSFTPFNAPLLAGVLGDLEVAASFSVKADLAEMIRFEIALAKAEFEAGVIPEEAASVIRESLGDFEPDVRALAAAAETDGMSVPNLIAQMREKIGEPHAGHLHFGSTSQDVIDTSLILRLKTVDRILMDRLTKILARIETLETDFGEKAFTARTRMQDALTVTVADRLRIWKAPLLAARARHGDLTERLYRLQFAGADGTLHKLGEKAVEVRARLAANLDLNDPGGSWHTERSSLVDYVNVLSALSAGLGKIGQDFALMAQNERDELAFDGGGKSSAMAHKQNPVRAELLITLHRFMATLAGGMHQSQVHEQERSGAMWALEWMLIPQACVACGASLRQTERLLASITRLGPA